MLADNPYLHHRTLRHGPSGSFCIKTLCLFLKASDAVCGTQNPCACTCRAPLTPCFPFCLRSNLGNAAFLS